MLWRNGIQKPSKLRFRSFSEKAFFLRKKFASEKLDQFSQSEPGESANFIKAMDLVKKKSCMKIFTYFPIHIFSPILHIIIFLALNSMEAPKGNWSLFRPSIHAFTTSATTSSALAKSFRKESLESCIWSLAQVWKLQFFLSQINNSAFYFEIIVKWWQIMYCKKIIMTKFFKNTYVKFQWVI